MSGPLAMGNRFGGKFAASPTAVNKLEIMPANKDSSKDCSEESSHSSSLKKKKGSSLENTHASLLLSAEDDSISIVFETRTKEMLPPKETANQVRSTRVSSKKKSGTGSQALMHATSVTSTQLRANSHSIARVTKSLTKNSTNSKKLKAASSKEEGSVESITITTLRRDLSTRDSPLIVLTRTIRSSGSLSKSTSFLSSVDTLSKSTTGSSLSSADTLSKSVSSLSSLDDKVKTKELVVTKSKTIELSTTETTAMVATVSSTSNVVSTTRTLTTIESSDATSATTETIEADATTTTIIEDTKTVKSTRKKTAHPLETNTEYTTITLPRTESTSTRRPPNTGDGATKTWENSRATPSKEESSIITSLSSLLSTGHHDHSVNYHSSSLSTLDYTSVVTVTSRLGESASSITGSSITSGIAHATGNWSYDPGPHSRTTQVTATATHTQATPTSNPTPTPTVVGSVVGSVAGVAMIALVVVILLNKFGAKKPGFSGGYAMQNPKDAAPLAVAIKSFLVRASGGSKKELGAPDSVHGGGDSRQDYSTVHASDENQQSSNPLMSERESYSEVDFIRQYEEDHLGSGRYAQPRQVFSRFTETGSL
ncbi:hypothetical protein TRVA0_004S03092 [Trichomonascus vanleenenianus]|uniref:uncharacterized protein n=1 Tax=Trichomonascus vanleenenianus TaxID=2268995 RepID=UPI003EC9BCA3